MTSSDRFPVPRPRQIGCNIHLEGRAVYAASAQ